MRRWILLISSKEAMLLTDCLLGPSIHPRAIAWRINRDKTFRNVPIRYFEKTGFQVCHAWLTSSELRTSVQFADATAAFSSCWLALDQHQTCLREATSYLGDVKMDPTIDRWSEFPSG